MAPWNGTGAEDYFNSGYYYLGRPPQRFCNPEEVVPPAMFQQPTYGLMVKVNGVGAISTYKWHIIDGPTWMNSVDAQMEHGANNNNPDTYVSSLAFWYSSTTHKEQNLFCGRPILNGPNESKAVETT